MNLMCITYYENSNLSTIANDEIKFSLKSDLEYIKNR